MNQEYQFERKATLTLLSGEKALDVSDLHFKFKIVAEDEESPNNASVRVYNLSKETLVQVKGEFNRVVIQAGYEGNFGVIFDGTIRQFRTGRESATDTYLDILAADGDLAYNFATLNQTLASGSNAGDVVAAAVTSMRPLGIGGAGSLPAVLSTGGVLPRGKVLFGLARAVLRAQVRSLGATWSIQAGKINIVPLTSYLPTEAVVLNGQTGLIGRPEQTENGIYAKCLINPRLVVGGVVQINNAAINQAVQRDVTGAPLRYDKYAGLQLLADISTDGLYRVYVIEYEGDTRGVAWYCDLTLLSIDPIVKKIKAY
jgi:hypothetical protein